MVEHCLGQLTASHPHDVAIAIGLFATPLLLPAVEQQAEEILEQYNHFLAYLEQTLEKEAEEKIASNRRLPIQFKQKIETYNQAFAGINSYLQAMQLYDHLLPFGQSDFIPVSTESEAFNLRRAGIGVFNSNGIADAVKVEV